MNKLIMFLSSLLTSLFIISCTSCQTSPTNNCNGSGGDCNTAPVPVLSSSASTQVTEPDASAGSTSILVDEANYNNACLPEANLLCSDTHVPGHLSMVKQEDWQMAVPTTFQVKSTDKKEVVYMSYSNSDNALLVVMKEKFTGTFEQYVLTSLRSSKDAGAKVESTKTVDSEGKKFVLLEATKDDIKIWTLVTVKNGFGYGVSCGGPPPYAALNSVCSFITNSFTLN